MTDPNNPPAFPHLLPCPFCGGEASLYTKDEMPPHENCHYPEAQVFFAFAQCHGMRCGVRMSEIYCMSRWAADYQAIFMWNTRLKDGKVQMPSGLSEWAFKEAANMLKARES